MVDQNSGEIHPLTLDLVKEIKELVANDELANALEKLASVSSLQADAINLRRNLTQTQRDDRTGSITPNEAQAQYSRIAMAILNMLQEAEVDTVQNGEANPHQVQESQEELARILQELKEVINAYPGQVTGESNGLSGQTDNRFIRWLQQLLLRFRTVWYKLYPEAVFGFLLGAGLIAAAVAADTPKGVVSRIAGRYVSATAVAVAQATASPLAVQIRQAAEAELTQTVATEVSNARATATIEAGRIVATAVQAAQAEAKATIAALGGGKPEVVFRVDGQQLPVNNRLELFSGAVYTGTVSDPSTGLSFSWTTFSSPKDLLRIDETPDGKSAMIEVIGNEGTGVIIICRLKGPTCVPFESYQIQFEVTSSSAAEDNIPHN